MKTLTLDNRLRRMTKVNIITILTITCALFSIDLPSAVGYTAPSWKGISFHYRFKKVGTTILKATLTIERAERLYMVKASVDSTGVTAPFFRMHNQFSSYVKDEGLEPWRYIKEINQWGILSSKKKYTDILSFNLSDSTVTVVRVDPYQVKEVSIPPQTYDPLSIFLRYFLDSEIGGNERITMRIYDGIKIREVSFVTSHNTLPTPLYGSIATTCLESTVPFSCLGDREGVIKIWYTNDERRFPVDISLELPSIGTVEFELQDVEIW